VACRARECGDESRIAHDSVVEPHSGSLQGVAKGHDAFTPSRSTPAANRSLLTIATPGRKRCIPRVGKLPW